MNQIIELVRKEGIIKVANKELAENIVSAAAKAGFIFESKKQGWNWLVSDGEEN